MKKKKVTKSKAKNTYETPLARRLVLLLLLALSVMCFAMVTVQ